jgi:CO/xanthine dehydrogenase Mo-binding subunit
MDTLAHCLGLDPLAFRLKNLLRPTDPFATGEMIPEAHFAECLEAAAHNLGWEQPYQKHPAPHLKRGRGLGVMMKNTTAASRSECRLELDGAGRVTLYTSAVEMGQGAHTALAQVCAEALGLPLEAISVEGPDTQRTPYDAQTSASRTAYMMGNAVVDGATALKRQLRELAAPIFECPPEQLVLEAGCVFAEDDSAQRLGWGDVLRLSQVAILEANGAFQTWAGLDPQTGQGVASPHWHQGAGACEVEVDVDTGQVRVRRYQAAAFAGRVINPTLAGLQNDGNVIFGLGPALMEEMVFDGGQLINANLSDYLIPSIRDIPAELESVSLEGGGEIHGLGEMTLPPVAPAIANAIYDAVGVRIRSLPLTAEKVYRALHPED